MATFRTLGTTTPTPPDCDLHSPKPTSISFNRGLQSHGGHFRDCTGTLAATAVMWPRPCQSGLANPAEEQRTQNTGSLAGSGRVACKPLLSQSNQRSQALPIRPPPHSPHGVCAQGPHPSFLQEHELQGSSRGVIVGSPLSQGPSRHTAGALPVLGGSIVWGHELSHPPLAAFPEGACSCHHFYFQGRDGCPGLQSPPRASPSRLYIIDKHTNTHTHTHTHRHRFTHTHTR